MKIKLPEHDHKLTNFLKVLLFSLLMLLPFLDIGTRCGYVILNKNAYQSYSEVKVQNNVSIDNYQNIAIGTKYSLTTKPFGNYNQFASGIQYVSLTAEELGISQSNYENINFILINQNAQFIRFSNRNAVTTWIAEYPYTANESFDIIFNYFDSGIQNTLSWFFVNQINYTTDKLDNVFDYSIDKMANSPLYKWTTSTGMYTGVNAMTTGLGITTPLFAILITYWMFLTIIYIIIDIVLTLFTFMTHLFTNKKE